MYDDAFKYPSAWTESWDSYLLHKQSLMDIIVRCMENYESRIKLVKTNAASLTDNFFSAANLIKNIK
jgi:predicted component of type VI protein secretion system